MAIDHVPAHVSGNGMIMGCRWRMMEVSVLSWWDSRNPPILRCGTPIFVGFNHEKHTWTLEVAWNNIMVTKILGWHTMFKGTKGGSRLWFNVYQWGIDWDRLSKFGLWLPIWGDGKCRTLHGKCRQHQDSLQNDRMTPTEQLFKTTRVRLNKTKRVGLDWIFWKNTPCAVEKMVNGQNEVRDMVTWNGFVQSI